MLTLFNTRVLNLLVSEDISLTSSHLTTVDEDHRSLLSTCVQVPGFTSIVPGSHLLAWAYLLWVFPAFPRVILMSSWCMICLSSVEWPCPLDPSISKYKHPPSTSLLHCVPRGSTYQNPECHLGSSLSHPSSPRIPRFLRIFPIWSTS